VTIPEERLENSQVPSTARAQHILHIPRESGRVFQRKPATHSDGKAATFWPFIGRGGRNHSE